MKAAAAFTESYTENLLMYRHISDRQIRILGGSQSVVDFQCCWYLSPNLTTMKAMIFREKNPMKSNLYFQRLLCGSFRIDFKAECC